MMKMADGVVCSDVSCRILSKSEGNMNESIRKSALNMKHN